MALRECSIEVREEPGYIGVFEEKTNKQNKPGSQNIEDSYYLKKNRHLQLMNLALFYVWEDARV